MKISKRLAEYRRQRNPSLGELRYGLRSVAAYLVFFLVWTAVFARYFAPPLAPAYPPPGEPDLGNLLYVGQWWLAACFLQLVLGVYFLSTRARKLRRLLAAMGDSPPTHPTLWAWAYFLFSASTLETVFLPLLSDLEVERAGALERRGPRAARRVRRLGCFIFWKTVAVQLCRSALWRFRRPGPTSS